LFGKLLGIWTYWKTSKTGRKNKYWLQCSRPWI